MADGAVEASKVTNPSPMIVIAVPPLVGAPNQRPDRVEGVEGEW